MKNKGFTLTELLAMLVVLGILMAVSIPNITGMVKNQKLNIIRSDAIKVVDTMKTKIAKDKSIQRPKNNECLIFSLDYLNDNDNFDKGPNGGLYHQFDSFVLFTKYNNEYKYYVRLVEQRKINDYFGIELIDINDIKEADSNKITKINDYYGLTDNSIENVNILKTKTLITNICDTDKITYYIRIKHYCTKYQNSYFNADGDLVPSKEQCENSCGGEGTCD